MTGRADVDVPFGSTDGVLHAAAVTPAHMHEGLTHVALVTGGAAGDHHVAGIAVGDEIAIVLHISTAASVATIEDLTAEFEVLSAGHINNATHTDTTNDQLLVIWNDLT